MADPVGHLEFVAGSSEATLYLNVLVVPQEVLIGLQASEQEDANPLGFQALRGVSKQTVQAVLAEGKVRAWSSQELSEALPVKLRELGVEAMCEEVFKRGTLVVFKLTVVSADLTKLEGKEPTGLDFLCQCVKAPTRQETLSPQGLHQLLVMLPEKLPLKLAGEGFKVEVIAKSVDEQRNYFETALREFGDSGAMRDCRVPGCSIS